MEAHARRVRCGWHSLCRCVHASFPSILIASAAAAQPSLPSPSLPRAESVGRGAVTWFFDNGTNATVDIPARIQAQVQWSAHDDTDNNGDNSWTVTATAYYDFSQLDPGSLGPSVTLERTDIFHARFGPADTASEPAPSAAALEAMLPSVVTLRYSEGAGAWQICADRDFIELGKSVPLPGSLPSPVLDEARYGTGRSVAYVYHVYEHPSDNTYTSGQRRTYLAWMHAHIPTTPGTWASGPASPICDEVGTMPGVEFPPDPIPWEPEVLPTLQGLEPVDPTFEPTVINPTVTPSINVREMAEPDAPSATPYTSKIEEAVGRWKERLGLSSFSSWNAGSVNAQTVWAFDFDLPLFGPLYIEFDLTEFSSAFSLVRLIAGTLVTLYCLEWIIVTLRGL